MNVILFGFRKCGKAYYGMKAAQQLHMDFIESDYLVEKIYATQHTEVLSHRDITKKHGFDFYCELEIHAISLLLQKKNCIICLGGGVVFNPDNVSRLKQVGTLVYIKPPKEELKLKTLSAEIPSYLDPEHPSASFDRYYEEKLPIYDRIPSYVIETENKTEEEVLELIAGFAKLTHPWKKEASGSND